MMPPSQSRRLQTVLSASKTAAPPAPLGIVPKAAPAEGCVCPQSFATGTQRRREKPGIEEQHNTVRLTPITQNRSQRFFSLRSNEVSTGSGSDRVSPQSGCQHKAWGASPRIETINKIGAREAGDRVVDATHALDLFATDSDSAVAHSAGKIRNPLTVDPSMKVRWIRHRCLGCDFFESDSLADSSAKKKTENDFRY